jgi:pyruvate/2-oxoglutarate dehydrogenase complex dihydrolipoamide acyltransferase (E2) component
MSTTNEGHSDHPPASPSASTAGPAIDPKPVSAATPAQPVHPEQRQAAGSSAGTSPNSSKAAPAARRKRKGLLLAGGAVALAAAVYVLVPLIRTALNTVSTDDAYVNGHVTFLAARVAGQVSRVLVDDNMRVKQGDLLVQLDKEPYQVQVAIKQAAVNTSREIVFIVIPPGRQPAPACIPSAMAHRNMAQTRTTSRFLRATHMHASTSAMRGCNLS